MPESRCDTPQPQITELLGLCFPYLRFDLNGEGKFEVLPCGCIGSSCGASLRRDPEGARIDFVCFDVGTVFDECYLSRQHCATILRAVTAHTEVMLSENPASSIRVWHDGQDALINYVCGSSIASVTLDNKSIEILARAAQLSAREYLELQSLFPAIQIRS